MTGEKQTPHIIISIHTFDGSPHKTANMIFQHNWWSSCLSFSKTRNYEKASAQDRLLQNPKQNNKQSKSSPLVTFHSSNIAMVCPNIDIVIGSCLVSLKEKSCFSPWNVNQRTHSLILASYMV